MSVTVDTVFILFYFRGKFVFLWNEMGFHERNPIYNIVFMRFTSSTYDDSLYTVI
jgi:hypothetical protein